MSDRFGVATDILESPSLRRALGTSSTGKKSATSPGLSTGGASQPSAYFAQQGQPQAYQPPWRSMSGPGMGRPAAPPSARSDAGGIQVQSNYERRPGMGLAGGVSERRVRGAKAD